MKDFIVGFLIGMFLNILGASFLIGNKEESFIRGYFYGALIGTIIIFIVLLIFYKIEVSRETNLN